MIDVRVRFGGAGACSATVFRGTFSLGGVQVGQDVPHLLHFALCPQMPSSNGPTSILHGVETLRNHVWWLRGRVPRA